MPLASIPTFSTGDTIEASWANTLRDNGNVLDARTGGDPGAAGKIPVSSGALAAAWLAAGTEGHVLLISSGVPTYARVSGSGVASDIVTLTDAQTLTGPKTLTSPVIQGTVGAGTGLTMPGFQALVSAAAAGGWTFANSGAGGFGMSVETPNSNDDAIYAIRAGGAGGVVYLNSDGSVVAEGPITATDFVTVGAFISTLPNGTPPMQLESATLIPNLNAERVGNLVPGSSTGNLAINASGNKVAAALAADLAADSTLCGGLQPGTAAGRIAVYDSNVRVFAASTADTATSATSATTAGTATNSAALGGVAASGYPTLNNGGNFATAPTINSLPITIRTTGTYAGNGGATQTVALGFNATLIIGVGVTSGGNGAMFMAYTGNTMCALEVDGSPDVRSDNTVGISGTSFTAGLAAGTNTSGITYRWFAFG